MITLQKVDAKYQNTPILHDLTISTIPKAALVAVIGPNGSGKSTLFKCIAGLMKICGGTITYDSKDIRSITLETLAKHICYMPQNTYTNASLTVFEVILMAKKFDSRQSASQQDLHRVSQVLNVLRLDHLSQRYVSELSGGQAQLVSLAQTLVRKPNVLLLDEPTSALDLHHQIEALDLIRLITQKTKMTTLVSLHDLSLAGRYADYIMVLHQGRISAYGETKQVLNNAMLEKVYGVKAEFIHNEYGTYVLPINAINSKELDYFE